MGEMGEDMKRSLSPKEAKALAHLVSHRQLADCDFWLHWEDYPSLDRASFDQLCVEVRELALYHAGVSDNWQRIDDQSAYAHTQRGEVR